LVHSKTLFAFIRNTIPRHSFAKRIAKSTALLYLPLLLLEILKLEGKSDPIKDVQSRDDFIVYNLSEDCYMVKWLHCYMALKRITELYDHTAI